MPKLSPSSIPNKRRSARAVVHIDGWIETPHGEVHHCQTIDVSDAGVSIGGSGIPVNVGDRVRLSLMRSSAMQEGWLIAEVRWRSALRVGLEFVGVTQAVAGPRR